MGKQFTPKIQEMQILQETIKYLGVQGCGTCQQFKIKQLPSNLAYQ